MRQRIEEAHLGSPEPESTDTGSTTYGGYSTSETTSEETLEDDYEYYAVE
jgi:hypothetical protein